MKTRPWDLAQIQLPAVGLRESLLRVAFISSELELKVAAGAANPKLYNLAAKWKLDKPDKFNELLRLMRINMRQHDVTVGATYIVRVSGHLVPVTIIAVSEHGGWDGRNTVTGREVRIRTAGKLRRQVPTPARRSTEVV